MNKKYHAGSMYPLYPLAIRIKVESFLNNLFKFCKKKAKLSRKYVFDEVKKLIAGKTLKRLKAKLKEQKKLISCHGAKKRIFRRSLGKKIK
jgi:midasin (ATPase involved in ribosome maturation)